MHHGGAGREVGAEADSGCVGDTYAVGADVVQQTRELVDARDGDAGALERGAQAGEVGGEDGARVGPGDDGELCEETVEVEGVRRDNEVAE